MMKDDYTALIIEDEIEIRSLLSEFLKSTGRFKYVIEASNGLEAISKCENQKFDLITLDIMMPKSNGMEFIKNYRQYEKMINKNNKESIDTKFLVLSGNITTNNLKELINYKVKSFLAKPVGPVEFLDKVNELLDIKN